MVKHHDKKMSRMSENLLLLTMPTTMPNLSSCHQSKNKATNMLKKQRRTVASCPTQNISGKGASHLLHTTQSCYKTEHHTSLQHLYTNFKLMEKKIRCRKKTSPCMFKVRTEVLCRTLQLLNPFPTPFKCKRQNLIVLHLRL